MSFKPELSLSARKAFTLIELLVVIAIIDLLAGLLLPALAQSYGDGPDANLGRHCLARHGGSNAAAAPSGNTGADARETTGEIAKLLLSSLCGGSAFTA